MSEWKHSIYINACVCEGEKAKKIDRMVSKVNVKYSDKQIANIQSNL